MDKVCITDPFNNPGGTLIFKLDDSFLKSDGGQFSIPDRVIFTTSTEWSAVDSDGNKIEVEDPQGLYGHLTRTLDWATWDQLIEALSEYHLDFTFVNVLQDNLFEMTVYLRDVQGRPIVNLGGLDKADVDHRTIRLVLAQMRIIGLRYSEKLQKPET